jgi:hypothetical protein
LKTAQIYITITIFLAFNLAFRLTELGRLGPFYDESLNVLTSNTEHIKNYVSAMKVGRPFLELLFNRVEVISDTLSLTSLLHAARFQTAIIGIANSILIASIFYLLNFKIASLISFILASILPIFVLHDRLALQDPYSAFFFLISILVLVITHKIKNTIINYFLLISLGGFYALMILNKVSGFTVLPYYFAFYSLLNKEIFNLNTAKKVLLASIGFISLPILIYGSEIFNFCSKLFSSRHSPIGSFGFYSIYKKILDLILHTPNLEFITRYNSIIFLVLAFLICILAYDNKKFRVFAILSIFGLFLACFAYSSLGYARYYYVDCYQIVGIIALGINYIKVDNLQKSTRYILNASFIFLIFFSILRNYTEIKAQKNNYLTSFNSEGDYKQYISSFFSAYNFKKVKDFFKDKNETYIVSKISPAILALELLELHNSNLKFIYLYQDNYENELIEIIKSYKLSNNKNMYILDDNNYWETSNLNLIPIESIKRSHNNPDYIIYNINYAENIK